MSSEPRHIQRQGSPFPSPTLQKTSLLASIQKEKIPSKLSNKYLNDPELELSRSRTPSNPILIIIPPQDDAMDYIPTNPNGSQMSHMSQMSPLIPSLFHSYPQRLNQRSMYTTLHKKPEPFGTLVGSYEESILSGRMSQLPSKPLPFDAEIGVIATMKCQAKLKCPPHITIPFLGYFYDLEDEGCGTPYVGTINIGEFTNVKGYRIPPKGTIQIVIKL